MENLNPLHFLVKKKKKNLHKMYLIFKDYQEHQSLSAPYVLMIKREK